MNYQLTSFIRAAGRLPRALLACAALLASMSATGAPILLVDVAAQKLIGAQNVAVAGVNYNVSFVDGSCATVMNNCTNFVFTTQAGALAASEALRDQVFLDSPGLFLDSVPQLTRGCSNSSYCYVFTAFSVSQTEINLSFLLNRNDFNIDFANTVTTLRSFETWGTVETFAVWTVVATSIPEPGSLAMLGFGIIALGASSRGRRRTRL